MLRCYRLAAGCKDGKGVTPKTALAVQLLEELRDRDPVCFLEWWDRMERLWLERKPLRYGMRKLEPVVKVEPVPVEVPEPDPDGLEAVEVDTGWMGGR